MKLNLILLRIFTVSFLTVALTEFSCLAGEVTLEDNSLLVKFDTGSGALTYLENKSSHWTIERRPELGVSFRLFAPLPDRRYNPILGQKQHAASVEKISDHEVRLQWKNLVSENGGVLPITIMANVTLINGVLTFSSELINDSPLTVETMDYPYFGDFNSPTRSTLLEACVMRNGKNPGLQFNEIYPHFKNEFGYWGVFYPTRSLESPRNLFCLIQAPDQGLDVEMAAPALPYRLQYTFEQHPGVVSRVNNLVPPEDEISGIPVHLEFRICHFIFTPPHSKMTLVPVVLRSYSGDWHTGVNLYKQSHSALTSDVANP